MYHTFQQFTANLPNFWQKPLVANLANWAQNHGKSRNFGQKSRENCQKLVFFKFEAKNSQIWTILGSKIAGYFWKNPIARSCLKIAILAINSQSWEHCFLSESYHWSRKNYHFLSWKEFVIVFENTIRAPSGWQLIVTKNCLKLPNYIFQFNITFNPGWTGVQFFREIKRYDL